MKLKTLMTTVTIAFAFFVTVPAAAAAATTLGWSDWVQNLRKDAVARGISPELFDKVFSTIPGPSSKVLFYDHTQPEKRISFLKYRSSRADAYRIRVGRGKLKQYNGLLTEIGAKYGVSPCFITALWGLESSYGSYMGDFPVIQSLATLAYDGRRADFFRNQLFYGLEILQGGHVSLANFKGEWAGATGQTQFLPSSWHKYAVDYNGDGHKDIWKTESDVFASIANYLVQNGWHTGEPWAVEVTLPAGFNRGLMDAKITKTVADWQKLGIAAIGRDMPAGNLPASIIQPDGGPVFMIFNNFRVIMRWNASTYYAGTVGYTAEQICQKKL